MTWSLRTLLLPPVLAECYLDGFVGLVDLLPVRRLRFVVFVSIERVLVELPEHPGRAPVLQVAGAEQPTQGVRAFCIRWRVRTADALGHGGPDAVHRLRIAFLGGLKVEICCESLILRSTL